MTVRVILADDERLVRAGYRMILDSEPDLEVVGEAADGVEAVEIARRLAPDVVVMDVRMPRLDGIAATRALVARDPAPAVLVVTTFDLDEYVFEALRAGATGFLLKDAPEHQLLAALRTATEGVALFSPTVTRRLIETFAPRPSDGGSNHSSATRLDLLTMRETEVLTQLALGRSNAEIAETLTISETTVKTHVSRLLMKLGLASRSQAVVLAYETGLVRPGRGIAPANNAQADR
jgi:DNA-binding NarL/FixJ family response regulator